MTRLGSTWTLCVMVALANSQLSAQTDTAVLIWLSLDSTSGGSGPSQLEATIDAFAGRESPHRIYIWATLEPALANAPTGNFTSIGLNVRATSTGAADVLDLTRVELDNPLLASAGGAETYRHQFVVDSSEDAFTPCVIDAMSGMPRCIVVAPCTDSITGECGRVIPPLTIPPDDLLAAFSGFSIELPFSGRRGVGIGDNARLHADPMFDGENWRIGWFEFVPLNAGVAQVYLQVGRPGIARSGASGSAPIFFGSPQEVRVSGNEIFAESAEEDARLTIRLMPDYNRNGAVDAADYVVWRDTLGSASDLRADGNGNGIVGGEDYDMWKRYFGKVDVSGESAGSLAGVPEPSAVVLLATAIGYALAARHREKGRLHD